MRRDRSRDGYLGDHFEVATEIIAMHVGNHLRGAFERWVDEVWRHQDEDWRHCEVDGEDKDIHWLLGKLWHCTDVLPSGVCSDLDLPKGSAYAQAAREMKREIDREFRRSAR